MNPARTWLTAMILALLAGPLAAGPVTDEAAKLLESGDADAALAKLEGAPAEEQATSPYHTLVGRACLQKLQTLSFMEKGPYARRALDHLKKAVEIDPANVEARTTLGGYYLNAPPIAGGSTELALEQAVEIVKHDPAAGNEMLGGIHMREERYDEATAAFAQVLEGDPDHRGALYQTGKIAALTGSGLERGRACLERYLDLEVAPGYPGHDGAHWRLGMICEHEGDVAAARAAYERAVALNPDSDQYRASLEGLEETP